MSSNLNYYKYLFIGKVFGINCIISYLRNPNPKVTIKLLQKFGATVGKGTTIKRSIFFDNVYEDQNSTGGFSYFQIGENCYIGDCTFFDLS